MKLENQKIETWGIRLLDHRWYSWNAFCRRAAGPWVVFMKPDKKIKWNSGVGFRGGGFGRSAQSADRQAATAKSNPRVSIFFLSGFMNTTQGPAARRQKAFHETTYGPGAETSGFNLFDFRVSWNHQRFQVFMSKQSWNHEKFPNKSMKPGHKKKKMRGFYLKPPRVKGGFKLKKKIETILNPSRFHRNWPSSKFRRNIVIFWVKN